MSGRRPPARVPYLEMVIPAIGKVLSCLVCDWTKFPTWLEDVEVEDGREKFRFKQLSKQCYEYGAERSESSDCMYGYVPTVLFVRHTSRLYCSKRHAL